MSCDICNKKCAPYELFQLLGSYRTKEIEWICSDCKDDCNAHLDNLKSLSQKWYTRMFSAWLRNKRTRRVCK